MTAKAVHFVSFIVICVAVTAAAFCGRDISMAKQLAVYESLRTVSAIVFGVLGAWIALLYPKGLNDVFRGRVMEDDAEQVRTLFGPMKYATVIVTVSLLVELAVLIGRQSEVLMCYKAYIRTASCILLVSLVIAQLWSLLLLLVPVDQTEECLERSDAIKAKSQRMFGDTQVDKSSKEEEG